MYPFERFSEDAKKVLSHAQKEAEQARHTYIGTEHLLLGLLQVDSEARQLLHRLGVDDAKVRATIQSVLGRSERVIIQQIIPTSRVKVVIELSFDVARREGAANVTPLHLLVGLLEEGEGIAAHVLKDLGVTLEAVRSGRPAAPLPAPGGRVLVHDPEPPYRLWEGTVTGHQEGEVVVSIPQHPTRSQVTVAPDQLHPVPLRPGPTCERCEYREEADPPHEIRTPGPRFPEDPGG